METQQHRNGEPRVRRSAEPRSNTEVVDAARTEIEARFSLIYRKRLGNRSPSRIPRSADSSVIFSHESRAGSG
jgi:hypothetical protein